MFYNLWVNRELLGPDLGCKAYRPLSGLCFPRLCKVLGSFVLRRLFFKYSIPETNAVVLEGGNGYVELLDLFKGVDQTQTLHIQYFTLNDADRPIHELDGKTVEVKKHGDEDSIDPAAFRRRQARRAVQEEWDDALDNIEVSDDNLSEGEKSHPDSDGTASLFGPSSDGAADTGAVEDLFRGLKPASVNGSLSSVNGGSGQTTPRDDIVSDPGEFFYRADSTVARTKDTDR